MDLRYVCQSLRTPQSQPANSIDADPAAGLSSKRTRLLNRAVGTRVSPMNSPTTRHSQKIHVKTASPRRRATRSSARVSPAKSAVDSLPPSYHRRRTSDCQSDDSLNAGKSDVNSTETESWNNVPASAYHLLYRCLELNPFKRITAQQALSHPFLTNASSSNSSLR